LLTFFCFLCFYGIHLSTGNSMDYKKYILSKSFDLFMRYGIKSVTMDDIAKELGMSKKTLYQYFDNKSDLIEQIFQKHIEEEKLIIAQIRQQATDAIDEMLRIARFIVKMLQDISPTTVYDLKKYYCSTWDKMDTLHKKDIYANIKENLIRGIQQGVYRNDLNPDIIAKLYIAKTSLIIEEDIFPTRDYDMGELFQEFINYHIQGIASEKGRKMLAKHLAAEQQMD
jgi:AcrR family transcriptional regulator